MGQKIRRFENFVEMEICDKNHSAFKEWVQNCLLLCSSTNFILNKYYIQVKPVVSLYIIMMNKVF